MNYNEEIWKDIPEYEGVYQASNLGRIKPLERKVYKKINKQLKYVTYKEKILLQVQKNLKGNQKYYTVAIYKQGRRHDKKAHILVAEAFLNKEDFKCMPYEDRNLIDLDKLEVNHKDENPLNNNVENLEYCTAKYNCNYGTRLERIKNSKKRKLVMSNDL